MNLKEIALASSAVIALSACSSENTMHPDTMSDKDDITYFSSMSRNYSDTQARVCAAVKLQKSHVSNDFKVVMRFIPEVHGRDNYLVYNTQTFDCAKGNKPVQNITVNYGDLRPRLMLPKSN